MCRGLAFRSGVRWISSVTQTGEKKQGYALFDMDQTLIQWDTQLLFCNWVLRAEPVRRLFLLIFLPMLVFAKVLGSEGMKRVFLSFLWGMGRERLEELVESFVEQYVPGEFYPEMMEEVRRQKELGRITVLTSASPEIYAVPIGKALGFDHSFGTRVEYEEAVPLFPDFTRGNNKSEVKVSRLQEELGVELQEGKLPGSSGFSDSKVDLPMLELCDEVMAVHPEGSFLERAQEEGWQIVKPARVWKDRREFASACLRMMLGIYPISSGKN